MEVSENTALSPAGGGGGGIASFFGTLTVTNSTVSGNSTMGSSPSKGAALFVDNGGTASLVNDTIAANTSPVAAVSGENNHISARLTIVNNPASPANCAGTINDLGNNLWFGGTGGTCPGVNADPRLAALANNGGVSRTMALGAGSAAIDAGGACPSFDQRGFPRPVGTCDAGAYEANSTVADTTPPTCSLLGVTATNPKQQNVGVGDPGRGLQTVTKGTVTNAVVVVPYFLRGTKLQVVATAVKLDQSATSSWRFNAADQAGNIRLCA